MFSTFFKPPTLRRSVTDSESAKRWLDDLLSVLEEFWDADTPRIGEPGAKGWQEWQASHSNSPEPSVGDTSGDDQITPHDRYDAWYQREQCLDRRFQVAAKASDLEAADDEDPFRVVLFGDVAEFLFLITSPSAKLQLAYAALNFLGLPFTLQESGTNTPFAKDPYLTASIAASAVAKRTFWPPQPEGKRLTMTEDFDGPPPAPRAQDPFGCPVKLWSQDDDTVLGGSGTWFQAMSKVEIGESDEAVIRCVRERRVIIDVNDADLACSSQQCILNASAEDC
jgi:hypothetical protein